MRRALPAGARLLLPLWLALLVGCAPTVVERVGAPEERTLGSGGASYVATQQRDGARQPFLLLRPERPRAAVILFAGGDGDIKLDATGRIGAGGNFLVRSRDLFAAQGLAVAVIAPPTDRDSFRGFRATEAHVLDIKGVIAYLRARLGVPVWLVGTSRGTVSAAYVAARLPRPQGADGLVLTASLFKNSRGEWVYAGDPAAIRVPTLLVHHRDDACRVTPPGDAPAYLARLAHAPARELILIDGGGPPKGNACLAFHFHGFVGREAQVVKAIGDWIVAHPPTG